ncbi:MAG: type IV fimbrial biogenesis protein FimT [Glaciecola sp.]|jgi:type IV fimbrial biogenesis protein FimT|uniref:GspH/FimT family pseudopilin n=1 Tax=Congregibacter sp. TaxID=2744308 RepID=UPI0039E6BFC8
MRGTLHTPYPWRSLPSGFTLIELLLVVAMLSIALGITLAPLAKRVDDLRSATAMRHLSSVFALARQEALIRQRPITVCALAPDKRCNRQWTDNRSIAVFIDGNDNLRLDDTELRLREIRWPLTGGELSWRASLAKNHLTFEPNGGTWQNGTLYYCPKSRDARQARALVISHSGRNYMPGDSNGDGIREDREGRNLRC